ncbi:hypothetical protein, partial [Citrobacter telavivensis]|uniref:hypothetical protein n=1 Tax=Citrobacter telavivensis TaxID=2653932 RepID=UPI00359D4C5A
RSADGSVGSPHARVGNCQASNSEEAHPDGWAFLRLWQADKRSAIRQNSAHCRMAASPYPAYRQGEPPW